MDSFEIGQYDKWNTQKKFISLKNKKTFFKEREIWWCSLGLNIGRETYGKGRAFHRPVLILKKLSPDLCIVLPLTSKEKEGNWFISLLVHGEKRCVMMYQIKTMDVKRFYSRVDKVSIKDFNRVKEKLETLLELSHRHPVIYGDQ